MCKMIETLCLTLRGLKVAMLQIFKNLINVSAGYKLVYRVLLLFQQITFPLNREEQHDIEGGGQLKFKNITVTVSVFNK